MNLGFHLCIDDWCFQKGTKEQYTKCEKASEDGKTCYKPTIRYGSTIGGTPTKQTNRNNDIFNWCKQLFPTSIKGIASYNTEKTNSGIGALFWCYSYDENNPHWCDVVDGHWKDNSLELYRAGYHGAPYNVMDSVTCEITPSSSGYNYTLLHPVSKMT